MTETERALLEIVGALADTLRRVISGDMFDGNDRSDASDKLAEADRAITQLAEKQTPHRMNPAVAAAVAHADMLVAEAVMPSVRVMGEEARRRYPPKDKWDDRSEDQRSAFIAGAVWATQNSRKE